MKRKHSNVLAAGGTATLAACAEKSTRGYTKTSNNNSSRRRRSARIELKQRSRQPTSALHDLLCKLSFVEAGSIAHKRLLNTIMRHCESRPEDARFRDFGAGFALHHAMVFTFPSLDVINAIVSANPGAAVTQDDDGYFPLVLRLVGILISFEDFSFDCDVGCDTIWSLLTRCIPPPANFVSNSTGIPLDIVKAEIMQFVGNPLMLHDKANHATALHYLVLSKAPFKYIEFAVAAAPEAIRVADLSGHTPLHLACYGNEIREDVVSLFIKTCPDVKSMQDESGCSPLHIFLDHKTELLPEQQSIVELLMNEKVVSMQNAAGYTPVHLACLTRVISLGMVRSLAGALHPDCYSMTTKKGDTLLHVVCVMDASYEIIQYIHELFPAASSMADLDGHVPLDLLDPTHSCFEKIEQLLS